MAVKLEIKSLEVGQKSDQYPVLLIKHGKVYLAPNIYSMVDLSTGKTENRTGNEHIFYGVVSIQNK